MKKVISVLLAVLIALSFESMACFAIKTGDMKSNQQSNYDVNVSCNKNVDLEKRQEFQESNVKEYISLVKTLLYTGTAAYIVYKVGKPLANFGSEVSSVWSFFAGKSKDVVRLFGGTWVSCTHLGEFISSLWSSFIARNDPKAVGKLFNRYNVPNKQNMSDAVSIIQAGSIFAAIGSALATFGSAKNGKVLSCVGTAGLGLVWLWLGMPH